MNDTVRLEQRLEVRDFVAAVRSRLTDLTEEEREELVGGLDADMGDLVAEHGVEALPDAGAYAAELRSAAGFPAVAPRRLPRSAELRVGLTAWLDRRTATWNRWVDTGEHFGIPELVQTLRPVWWVVRALCASALVVELTGTSVYGFTLRRAVLGVVATVVSVQIGRGAWWPGTVVSRSLLLRLLVGGLNLFAIVLVPVMLQRFMITPAWLYSDSADAVDYSGNGLAFHGNPVRNVYAYDAQGHPLTGVQLVDQDGRRLMVDRDQYDDQTGNQLLLTPWLNGRTQLFSVFPLPEQKTDIDTSEPVGEAKMQVPPFASLPPVTLTGVQPSVLLTPAQVAAQKEARKEAQVAAQKAAAARAAKMAKAKAKKHPKHRFVSPGHR